MSQKARVYARTGRAENENVGSTMAERGGDGRTVYGWLVVLQGNPGT